jgi:predicted O-methyltransferase YrrM
MPLSFVSAILFLGIRRLGMQRMVWSKKIFMKVGVFPIMDHYYEPLFHPRHLRISLRQDRVLPGIDLNDREQLELLRKFTFNEELEKIPFEKTDNLEFYYRNPSIGLGDSEYLYNMIRLFKPRKIVEIGCGNSTLMAVNAVRQNKKENQNYFCEHVCIEPYENKWLESLGLKVFREKIENIEKKILTDLEANDILFIDSSHIIRPQGDVLFEYLVILPILKKGVLVHIHDIFTPKDYLDEWVLEDIKLWNEQYLLEAFLTFNKEYRIIGALNYLKHHYSKEIYAKCPILANKTDEEPCSFWLIKA